MIIGKFHKQDGLVLGFLAFLLVQSEFVMVALGKMEDLEFRVVHLAKFQLLSILFGLMAMAVGFFLNHQSSKKILVAWMITGGISLGILLALLRGDQLHGMPYLRFKDHWLNIIGLSSLGLLWPTSLLLSAQSQFKRPSCILLAFLPLGVFLILGSAVGGFCYSLALCSWIFIFCGISILPRVLAFIASLVLGSACLLGAFQSQSAPAFVYGRVPFFGLPVTLYERTHELNAHTEFVLSSVYQSWGIFLALCSLLTGLGICFFLFLKSLRLNSNSDRFLGIGVSFYLGGQIFLSTMASLSFIPYPLAGLSFPFLSYAGFHLLFELFYLGSIFGSDLENTSGVRVTNQKGDNN